MAKETTSSAVQHWVAVRLGHLGDVILATGVLAYFAERQAKRFVVVTKHEWADIFAENPYIEHVVGLKAADLAPCAEYAVFRELAKTYAGWGLLDLHGTLRSRLLAALWKGPVLRYPKMSIARRLFLASGRRFGGEALRRCSVPQRYALAFEQKAPRPEDLLPRVWLTPAERQNAAEKLTGLFGENSRPVALHPFAMHPFKAWPAGYWRKLAALCEGKGLPWIVIGRGEPVFPGRANDMTGQSSLRESSALLSHCRVLVTGDSGPMHLAGAVQTPVIGLFGPTTREWGFYPAGPEDVVLEQPLSCRPCSLHGRSPCSRGGECLAAVLPEDVFAEIEQRFF